MPCYTQQTSVVKFGVQTDVALLQRALEGLGFVVRKTTQGLYFSKGVRSGSFEKGTMTISGAETEDMNVYKRAYSAEVVRASATRFGWQVKQSEPNKFQVTRRV